MTLRISKSLLRSRLRRRRIRSSPGRIRSLRRRNILGSSRIRRDLVGVGALGVGSGLGRQGICGGLVRHRLGGGSVRQGFVVGRGLALRLGQRGVGSGPGRIGSSLCGAGGVERRLGILIRLVPRRSMTLRIGKCLLRGGLRRIGGLLLSCGGIGGSLRILVGLLVGRRSRLRGALIGGRGFENRLCVQRRPRRIVGVVACLFGRRGGRRGLRLLFRDRRIGRGLGCRLICFGLAQCRASGRIGGGLGHQVGHCGGAGSGVRIALRFGGRGRVWCHSHRGQGSRVRRQAGVAAEE